MTADFAVMVFLASVFGAVVSVALWVFGRYDTGVEEKFSGYTTWMFEQSKLLHLELTWWWCRLIIISSTVLTGVLAGVVAGRLWVGITGALLGLYIPRYVMKVLIARRRARINDQLVDGFVLISNALRAGLGFQQALSLAAEELAAPLSQEFDMVLSENALGVAMEKALEKMADRVGSGDFTMAAVGINVLRGTGGNLATAFDRIVHVLRERKRVEGKISSSTAQGRMQGLILVMIPFAIVVILGYMNPEMFRPMYTTGLGWAFLILAGILDLVGWLIIRKVITIDV